jgi:hypothetical protein
MNQPVRNAMRAVFFTLLLGIFFGNAVAAAPSSSDSRKIYGVDPRVTFSSYPTMRMTKIVGNSSPDIHNVPQPGWWDSYISQYTSMQAADPKAGGRKAFRHKLVKGMKYRQDSGYQSARAEIQSMWGRPGNVLPHVGYWAAYAFLVDNDHPFNGSGDDLDILELGHPITSKNSNPSPAFYLRRNGTWDAMVGSNTVLNGGTSTRKLSRVFSRPIAKGVWHYVIVQFKLEWDQSKSPYFRVWHAIGSGSPVQVCNTTIPNYYRESATYTSQKFGLYQWNVNSWGTSNTRTLYTKGLHIFKDQSGSPTLNANSMLEFIRGI